MTTRVTLTLEGESADVLPIVNEALKAGLVTDIEMSELGGDHVRGTRTSVPKARPAVVRPKRVAKLAAGDRVRVRMTSAVYHVTKGDTGTVVSVRRSGPGRVVTVDWDGGTTSDTSRSTLAKIRKRGKP